MSRSESLKERQSACCLLPAKEHLPFEKARLPEEERLKKGTSVLFSFARCVFPCKVGGIKAVGQRKPRSGAVCAPPWVLLPLKSPHPKRTECHSCVSASLQSRTNVVGSLPNTRVGLVALTFERVCSESGADAA